MDDSYLTQNTADPSELSEGGSFPDPSLISRWHIYSWDGDCPTNFTRRRSVGLCVVACTAVLEREGNKRCLFLGEVAH